MCCGSAPAGSQAEQKAVGVVNRLIAELVQYVSELDAVGERCEGAKT